MSGLAEDQASQRYEACADKARALLDDVRAGGAPAAGPGDEPDPLMLGWARYYLVRSLYSAERYDAAWAALIEQEESVWSLTADNAGWLYSAGAELAMRQGEPEAVVQMGMKAVELRMEAGDLGAALMTAATACALLEELDAEALQAPFAWFLIHNGPEYGAAPILHGFQFAADCLAEAYDAALARLVVEGLESLRDLDVADDMEGGLVRAQTLGRIEGAAWYRDAIPARERVRLEGIDALWDAAESADLDALHEVLRGRAGVEVDALRWQRPGMPTALMAAAFAGQVEAVEALLAAGADPSVVNPERRTAVVLAADQGRAGCVEALAKAGADVDQPGIFRQTALHLAAWQSHVQVVDVLVRFGASLEARDMTGATPLALAASEDVPDVIVRLLEAGADPHTVTDEGFTPAQIAEAEGLSEVAALLRSGRG